MAVLGIRGATTSENDSQAILDATGELLKALQTANPSMRAVDLASAFFTLTPDLNAVHPAKAAREMGWTEVPMMCASEIDVPGGLRGCIRVLLHWNTDLIQTQVKHVYLNEARSLRPDWAEIK
jgi:chorismate mutase